MVAVPDKIFVRNATVVTVQMRTSEAGGGILLLTTTPTFALRVGEHAILVGKGPGRLLR